MKPLTLSVQFLVLLVALTSAALASTTWFVDGVNGNDNNNCQSAATACKTLGHAIQLAASGDTIKLAPATYGGAGLPFSLNLVGANAATTILDGKNGDTVLTTSSGTTTLTGLTIRNGHGFRYGGGIINNGKLIINECVIIGNTAESGGGGISSGGPLIINKSTISKNTAPNSAGIAGQSGQPTLISNSTITGNIATNGDGAGISAPNLTITNSTITGNSASGFQGGGIWSIEVYINSSTISGNTAFAGAGVFIGFSRGIGTAVIRNSIVANNTGGNCFLGSSMATLVSKGYNLSSDNSCNFNAAGDLNNTDPMLGPLQNNGGPTQTMVLLSGSPAIDSGNPSGCTDVHGNLLGTDQRGMRRPDREDSGGCDRGAYEKQSD